MIRRVQVSTADKSRFYCRPRGAAAKWCVIDMLCHICISLFKRKKPTGQSYFGSVKQKVQGDRINFFPILRQRRTVASPLWRGLLSSVRRPRTRRSVARCFLQDTNFRSRSKTTSSLACIPACTKRPRKFDNGGCKQKRICVERWTLKSMDSQTSSAMQRCCEHICWQHRDVEGPLLSQWLEFSGEKAGRKYPNVGFAEEVDSRAAGRTWTVCTAVFLRWFCPFCVVILCGGGGGGGGVRAMRLLECMESAVRVHHMDCRDDVIFISLPCCSSFRTRALAIVCKKKWRTERKSSTSTWEKKADSSDMWPNSQLLQHVVCAHVCVRLRFAHCVCLCVCVCVCVRERERERERERCFLSAEKYIAQPCPPATPNIIFAFAGFRTRASYGMRWKIAAKTFTRGFWTVRCCAQDTNCLHASHNPCTLLWIFNKTWKHDHCQKFVLCFRWDRKGGAVNPRRDSHTTVWGSCVRVQTYCELGGQPPRRAESCSSEAAKYFPFPGAREAVQRIGDLSKAEVDRSGKPT